MLCQGQGCTQLLYWHHWFLFQCPSLISRPISPQPVQKPSKIHTHGTACGNPTQSANTDVQNHSRLRTGSLERRWMFLHSFAASQRAWASTVRPLHRQRSVNSLQNTLKAFEVPPRLDRYNLYEFVEFVSATFWETHSFHRSPYMNDTLLIIRKYI